MGQASLLTRHALPTRRALPACCFGTFETSHLLRALGDASYCGGLSLDSYADAEFSG